MAFNQILRTIRTGNYECIYLAIGCALPYRDKEINRQQHQQYPGWLDYFSNKKLILLFDTEIEFPLKLQDYVKFTDENIEFTENYTQFENTEMTVISVKSYFSLENNDEVLFFKQILEHVKNNKKHFIIETFTGMDNRLPFYNIVMNMPDYKNILKYAKCDIMDNDHGCFADYTDLIIPTDDNNYFMHPSLMDLCQVKKKFPQIYNKVLTYRYDNLYTIYNIYKSFIDGTSYHSDYIYNNTKLLLVQYIREPNVDINIHFLERALLLFVHELLIVTNNDLTQMEQFIHDLHSDTHNFMKNVYLIKSLKCS